MKYSPQKMLVNYKVDALDIRGNVVDTRIVPAWSASEAYLTVSNELKPHHSHITAVYRKGARE